MSSRSFARALDGGALTQLEWIDLCAAEPAVDGVDLAVEHFPRRDVEYLAQIRKLCVDRRLTVAALSTGLALGGADVDPQIDEMGDALEAAAAVGAPLVRFACGAASGSPGVVWRELIRALKAASERAKRVNVTLAMMPRDASLVSDEADIKRALKECDSAWLRLAVPATVRWETHSGDAIIETAAPSGSDLAAALRFRGFVSLEDDDGGLDAARLRRWAESFYAPTAP